MTTKKKEDIKSRQPIGCIMMFVASIMMFGGLLSENIWVMVCGVFLLPISGIIIGNFGGSGGGSGGGDGGGGGGGCGGGCGGCGGGG